MEPGKEAIGEAAAVEEAGSNIHYLRSTFAPEDGRCMCLFEASSRGGGQSD